MRVVFAVENENADRMSKPQARGRKPTPASMKNNGFSDRLAKTRALRSMERKDLALATGLSESALCRLETNPGGSTEAKTVFKLARALDVRGEWLWEGTEPMELAPSDKRILELRKKLENAEIADEELDRAVRRGQKRHHPAIVAVANEFARAGERHTADGWIARLEEIAASLSPLLPH